MKKALSEVVDGQQRLTAIFEFVHKHYETKYEYSRKIAEDIVDYLHDVEDDKELEVLKRKVAENKRFKLSHKMLPEIIGENILSYTAYRVKMK